MSAIVDRGSHIAGEMPDGLVIPALLVQSLLAIAVTAPTLVTDTVMAVSPLISKVMATALQQLVVQRQLRMRKRLTPIHSRCRQTSTDRINDSSAKLWLQTNTAQNPHGNFSRPASVSGRGLPRHKKHPGSGSKNDGRYDSGCRDSNQKIARHWTSTPRPLCCSV